MANVPFYSTAQWPNWRPHWSFPSQTWNATAEQKLLSGSISLLESSVKGEVKPQFNSPCLQRKHNSRSVSMGPQLPLLRTNNIIILSSRAFKCQTLSPSLHTRRQTCCNTKGETHKPVRSCISEVSNVIFKNCKPFSISCGFKCKRQARLPKVAQPHACLRCHACTHAYVTATTTSVPMTKKWQRLSSDNLKMQASMCPFQRNLQQDDDTFYRLSLWWQMSSQKYF